MASAKEDSNTTSDWSGKVVIKARLEDDIRIIPIHNEDITYDELILMMQRVYRGTLSSSDEITIKYQDSDGDLITMFDDADLSYALHTSKVLKITIFSPSNQKQSIPADVNIGEELSNIKLKLSKLIECLDVGKKSNETDRHKTSSTPQESGRASVPVSKLQEGKEFDPLSNGTGRVSGRTSVESHPGASFAPLHKPIPQQFSPQKQQQFPPQPSQTFLSQASQQQPQSLTPSQQPQSLPLQQPQSLPPQHQQPPPSPYQPQAQQNTPYQPNQQYQQQQPPQNIYQPPASKQQPTNQNYQSYQSPPQANNYPQQQPNAQPPPQSYPTNPAFSTTSNAPYSPPQPPQTAVAGQYNQYGQYKPPQGAYQPSQQFYPQAAGMNPFSRGSTGTYPRPQYPPSH